MKSYLFSILCLLKLLQYIVLCSLTAGETNFNIFFIKQSWDSIFQFLWLKILKLKLRVHLILDLNFIFFQPVNSCDEVVKKLSEIEFKLIKINLTLGKPLHEYLSRQSREIFYYQSFELRKSLYYAKKVTHWYWLLNLYSI
jgi:hypothetical protein